MADDLAATLRSLRDLHSKAVLDDDEYAQKLDRLRVRYGAEAVDALLSTDASAPPSGGTTQVLTGQATVAVAIAGDHHGHIFLDGQRAEHSAALLHAYLLRVVAACDTIPLQPFHDKRDLHDAAAVSLDQVYTELATTRLADREVLSRQRHDTTHSRISWLDGATFDAEAYYAAHVGSNLLPFQRREAFLVPHEPDRPLALTISGRRDLRANAETFDFERVSAQEFAAICREVLAKEALLFTAGLELVTETIAANRRLVLLGEPGSGKSTALRYLALTLARAAVDPALRLGERLEGWARLGEQDGRLLPLFVPLLPFARALDKSGATAAGAKELWNYIAGELEGQGRYPGLAAAVHSELDAGRLLLLLDGLDEVPTEGARRLVVRAVEAFAAAYGACRIVVSCRVRAYEGEQNAAWRLRDWPTATLADWSPGQMRAFVDGWYGAMGGLPADERERRRADLQAALKRRDDLRRLGVNPMLLTIMALVHFNDSRLPEERAALYGRCVEILLARWELGKVESGYASAYGSLMDYLGMPAADVKSLRPLLQQAAYEAQRAGSADSPGSLARDRLRVLVADALEGRHPNPHDAAKRFLEYTDLRAGLLQARGAGDEYVFPHQTFQEYLAGLQLVSGAAFVDQIMELRGEDRWRVPIFLGIGHAVNEGLYAIPYQLLNRLRCAGGRAEPQRHRDLILAAELAEDVGWPRLARGGDEFGQLRADLARDLAPVVEGTALPAPERIRAGELLAGLGDLRPGVCDLQLQMAPIAGGSFVIGETGDALEQAVELFIAQYNATPGGQLSAEERPLVRQLLGGWGEHAAVPMSLGSFALARYPVTNAQFKLFMEAGGYNPDALWWSEAARAWLRRDDATADDLDQWQRRKYKDRPEFWGDPRLGSERPNHPVVGISWYEAVAFCAWLTGHLDDGHLYRLPSEAEWEYAARGAERRLYPWGEREPDGERANYGQMSDGTTAVGCFPAGATPNSRLLDMAGNVWEWTRSAYQPYPYDPDDGREDVHDPAEKRFTLRGGAWFGLSIDLRPANRLNNTPDYRGRNVGFRLARHLKV